jgi:hypothetical protein
MSKVCVKRNLDVAIVHTNASLPRSLMKQLFHRLLDADSKKRLAFSLLYRNKNCLINGEVVYEFFRFVSVRYRYVRRYFPAFCKRLERARQIV